MRAEDVHKDVVEVEKLIAGILEQLKHLGKSLDSLNDAWGCTRSWTRSSFQENSFPRRANRVKSAAKERTLDGQPSSKRAD